MFFSNFAQNEGDVTVRYIHTYTYTDPDDKKLHVMQLSEEFSELIQSNAYYPPDGSKPQVAFDPIDRRKWISSVSASYARVSEKHYQPIILCPGIIRQLVKSALEREMPGIIVLSEAEVMAAGRAVSVEVIDKIQELQEDGGI